MQVKYYIVTENWVKKANRPYYVSPRPLGLIFRGACNNEAMGLYKPIKPGKERTCDSQNPECNFTCTTYRICIPMYVTLLMHVLAVACCGPEKCIFHKQAWK